MAHEIELLSICLQTPNCLPPLYWGDFGVGKTAGITALMNGLGWDYELLRPGERGEGALGVVPVPSEDRRVLHYPLPDWAARLAASDRPSLVFLDEISSTPPALQPAIMGLALDGIIAGQRLPERVKRCAVANPIDQAAGGWDLAPALANRFVHLTWTSPDANGWVAWLSGQASTCPVVKIDPSAWEKEWGIAKALGAAFIRSHPTSLHEDVSKAVGRTPPAMTTPRTWESALRLLASCRTAERMDLYPALAQGALGPGTALEGPGGDPGGAWLVWLKNNDLPDPEDLLDDPTLFVHDKTRPDRTFATLYAVAEAGLAKTTGKKLSEKTRGERWQKAWRVLARALEQNIGKDLILLPARQMAARERRPMHPLGAHGEQVATILAEFVDLYA